MFASTVGPDTLSCKLQWRSICLRSCQEAGKCVPLAHCSGYKLPSKAAVAVTASVQRHLACHALARHRWVRNAGSTANGLHNLCSELALVDARLTQNGTTIRQQVNTVNSRYVFPVLLTPEQTRMWPFGPVLQVLLARPGESRYGLNVARTTVNSLWALREVSPYVTTSSSHRPGLQSLDFCDHDPIQVEPAGSLQLGAHACMPHVDLVDICTHASSPMPSQPIGAACQSALA